MTSAISCLTLSGYRNYFGEPYINATEFLKPYGDTQELLSEWLLRPEAQAVISRCEQANPLYSPIDTREFHSTLVCDGLYDQAMLTWLRMTNAISIVQDAQFPDVFYCHLDVGLSLADWLNDTPLTAVVSLTM